MLGRQRPSDLHDAKFNSSSKALNSIGAGAAGGSNNIGRSSRGSRLKLRQNNRQRFQTWQFSGGSDQSNLNSMEVVPGVVF